MLRLGRRLAAWTLVVLGGCGGSEGPPDAGAKRAIRPYGYNQVVAAAGDELIVAYAQIAALGREPGQPARADVQIARASGGGPWVTAAAPAAVDLDVESHGCAMLDIARSGATVAVAYQADGPEPGTYRPAVLVSRDAGATFTRAISGEVLGGLTVDVTVLGDKVLLAYVQSRLRFSGGEVHVAVYDLAAGAFTSVASLGRASSTECVFLETTPAGAVVVVSSYDDHLLFYWSSPDGVTWKRGAYLSDVWEVFEVRAAADTVVAAVSRGSPRIGGLARTSNQGPTWDFDPTGFVVTLAPDGGRLWGLFATGKVGAASQRRRRRELAGLGRQQLARILPYRGHEARCQRGSADFDLRE